MRIAIGLPSTVPGATAHSLLTWAHRADAGPFSSVAVLDRVAYDSYDPFITLAAVAGVTNRVRLATNIAIGPLRNTALLAKSVASLHTLAGGRLTLGLAVGARREDYDAVGADFRDRGRLIEQQLQALRQGKEIIGTPGAMPHEGPRLMVGGSSDEVFARMARLADGYMHGGGPPRALARAAEKARAAWEDAGRPGLPEIWGQVYFALGDDDVITAGATYLKSYYAFVGPFADRIAAGLLTSPQAIAQLLRGYEDAGCNEVALYPTSGSPEQLDRLMDALAKLGVSGEPAS
jgi:alkanesulfonate monooxygenase SsuD/methylene tetrahydromethanopterin reductase-like flavin-dependent oxidoreductase (luciferase family)